MARVRDSGEIQKHRASKGSVKRVNRNRFVNIALQLPR
jgi:hypothetical protein